MRVSHRNWIYSKCVVLAAAFSLSGGCIGTRGNAPVPAVSSCDTSPLAPAAIQESPQETGAANLEGVNGTTTNSPISRLPPVATPTSGVRLASLDVITEPDSGPEFDSAEPVALDQPTELLPLGDVSEPAPISNRVGVCAIDFSAALAIAAGDNPQVAFSRQRINEAYAQLQAANVLWVPSLRAGVSGNKHEGTIQDVEGTVLDVSRNSLYSGFGAQAVGTGSPAVPGLIVNFHTRDAIYQPRISGQLLAASRQASRATTNDILLETALAYNDLLEAYEIQAVAADTLEHSKRLAELTGNYARAGQGLPADADRAQAELALREVDSQRAVENIQVASVRLARLLSHDPTVSLVPQETAITPIELAPMNCELKEMIATGLSNRPELAESRFLAGAAIERLRREKNAPLVPSVLLGLSYGGYGGGPGGNVDNFNDRLDVDAVAYWELRNLGLGEQAARNEARSRVEQAHLRELQIMDQVASDIAEAYAQVVSRREQVTLAQGGISAARESYHRNSQRIQDAQGLPIEVLQSITALDAAQRQYVRCVADYNRAQFRLQRALGWPIN